MSAEDQKARELFEDVRKLWSPDKPDSQANCLHRMVRPIGFPPAVWHALLEIREAQKRLEDDYPRFNESGKRFAVDSAAAALRQAHANIMVYVAEVSNTDA